MPPEIRRLLPDMLASAEAIIEFTRGKRLADLSSDKLLRSAIYFQFAVIGEALTQLRRLDDGLSAQITDAWKIIGFRNQIIHGYAKIDDEITWRIVEDKVPVLRSELLELLGIP